MVDTTIADDSGRTYVLRKGINVQMPSIHLHLKDDAWGADAADFNPRRLVQMDRASAMKQKPKDRQISYITFDSGKHL
jgi:hypothetical protein